MVTDNMRFTLNIGGVAIAVNGRDIADLKRQLDDLSGRMKPENKEFKDRAAEIMRKLTAVEEELIQTRIRSGQDALNYPIKLNNKLAALMSLIDASDDAPTAQAFDVYNDLTARIDAQLAAIARIKATNRFGRRLSVSASADEL